MNDIYILHQHNPTCDEQNDYYFLYKDLAITGMFNLIGALVKDGYEVISSEQNPTTGILVSTYLLDRATHSDMCVDLLQTKTGSRGVF